jgi:hypothetical protein
MMERYRNAALYSRAVYISLAALLLVSGGWGWFASEPPVDIFIVAGAEDVVIETVASTLRSVSYRAPGDAYAWRVDVAARLVERGWRLLNSGNPQAHQHSYQRTTDLLIGSLAELAVLDGEANRARISIYRTIVPRYGIPWPGGIIPAYMIVAP